MSLICPPSHNKCQSVSQHGRLYRNSFSLIIEELFYLNSRETLERLGTFLQVESLALIKLQRMRLERQLTKAYSWTNLADKNEVEKLDRVCEGLYASSVFTPVGSKNSITRKNEKYPIKQDYQ